MNSVTFFALGCEIRPDDSDIPRVVAALEYPVAGVFKRLKVWILAIQPDVRIGNNPPREA